MGALPPDEVDGPRTKASFLYRFLNYVDFPAGVLPAPGKPLVIGVAGADDVSAELDDVLRGRSVDGRPVMALRLADGDPLTGVQLLYAGRHMDLARSALVRAARSLPVLLVTDAPDGLAHGAVFNLVRVGERIRFETSLTAAQRASLRISSRLLSVSERVTGTR